jgi:hypothetical protein
MSAGWRAPVTRWRVRHAWGFDEATPFSQRLQHPVPGRVIYSAQIAGSVVVRLVVRICLVAVCTRTPVHERLKRACLDQSAGPSADAANCRHSPTTGFRLSIEPAAPLCETGRSSRSEYRLRRPCDRSFAVDAVSFPSTCGKEVSCGTSCSLQGARERCVRSIDRDRIPSSASEIRVHGSLRAPTLAFQPSARRQ